MRPFTDRRPGLLVLVLLLAAACSGSDGARDTTAAASSTVTVTTTQLAAATPEAPTTIAVPVPGETAVAIDAGDHTIPGIFTVPSTDSARTEFPAVLMLHGFGADKNEGGNMFGRLAEHLGVAGYASLRIDFAGTGDSRQPWIENTFDGMVADARAALDWLTTHHFVDADRLGVHGWSFGGRVAATIAGTDDRIRTLSTWAGAIQDGTDGMVPFFSMPIRNCTSERGRETLYQCAIADGSVLYDPFGTGPFELSLAWFETMEASESLTVLRDFDGRQLAVHGELDDVIRPAVSRNAIAVSGSHDATLRIIPGGDHTFGVYDPEDPGITAEEVLTITAQWIEDKL